MKNYFIITLIFSILFTNCKSKKTMPVFTDITELNIDASPKQNGTTDVTDWQISDVFTTDENNLFGGNSNLNIGIVPLIVHISGYPNSCNGIFHFQNNLDTSLNTEIRIVKSDFTIIKSISNPNNRSIAIDISNLTQNNEYVRMYYKLSSGAYEYRGHGDIKIVK
jgi:hypothetical protein